MERFSYEENGYNRKEVNQFVKDVIAESESIVERVKMQQEQIAKLEKKIEYYKGQEDLLRRAILRTEETADIIKKEANKESDAIIDDAKKNASKIVNDALIRAEELESQRLSLANKMKIFKRKLRLIMEQQLEVVEEIEDLKIDDK